MPLEPGSVKGAIDSKLVFFACKSTSYVFFFLIQKAMYCICQVTEIQHEFVTSHWGPNQQSCLGTVAQTVQNYWVQLVLWTIIGLDSPARRRRRGGGYTNIKDYLLNILRHFLAGPQNPAHSSCESQQSSCTSTENFLLTSVPDGGALHHLLSFNLSSNTNHRPIQWLMAGMEVRLWPARWRKGDGVYEGEGPASAARRERWIDGGFSKWL